MKTFRCAVCEAFTHVDAGEKEPRCIGCESKLDPSGKPQEVDAAALKRAIELSPVPVVVDFWALWCTPCIVSGPILKAFAATMAGDLVVLAVNTQDEDEAGEAYAIHAVPTLALFEHGEEVSRQIGLLPRAELEHWVRTSLSRPRRESRLETVVGDADDKPKRAVERA